MGKTVRVESDLTIFKAAELREILLARMRAAGADLEVDLAAVKTVDDAGFQLLVAANKSAGRAGAALRIRNAPPALREYFDVAGVEGMLHVGYKGE